MKQSDIQVTLIDHMGNDLSVVNAARVSFHKESEFERNENSYGHLNVKDEKLVNYLAKHKHTSPFNHAFITMRVKAPIFVARQLVKHKFMPWNEVSRRYVDDEPEFYIPHAFRKKADNVKQGSSEAEFIPESLWSFKDAQEDVIEHSYESVKLYNHLLENEVCAEQARMVLPQNMMTEWIWSGTLGAWCDMLRLRLDPHTQAESRIVANKVKEIIEPLFPVSVKALLSNE